MVDTTTDLGPTLPQPSIFQGITVEEYYMGRDKLYPEELSDAHKVNAQRTVDKANALLELFGQTRRVVSGWRPAAINAATKGAASNSKHMLCLAVDLEDVNRELKSWCLNNKDILESLGVWCEDPSYTQTWLHVQVVPPASGKLFFIP